MGYHRYCAALFFALLFAAVPLSAQVQSYLGARSPFIWNGVTGHTLIGAETSSINMGSASIVKGLYGELDWDVEGLLGSDNSLKAQAPSFLFKYIPFQTPAHLPIGHIITLSLGTRALSGIDGYAGWGTYLQDGRLALGAGLELSWEQLENGTLAAPDQAWVFRSYSKLTANIAADAAATLRPGQTHIEGDVALIYTLLSPRFHIYVALLDVLSTTPDRRLGLSYAIAP